MQFTDLFIYFLAIITIAHAYAIPIKRVRIHDAQQHISGGAHKRHARFLKRQLLEGVGDIASELLGEVPGLGDFPGYVITLVPAPAHATPAQQSHTSSIPITTSQASTESSTSPQISSSSAATTSSVPQGSVPPSSSGVSETISPTTAPTTTVTSQIPTATSIPIPQDNDGSRKYVVAHHMVGNTYPYTIDDWAEDIALAHASGIDGFALNCGIDEWEPARVADA